MQNLVGQYIARRRCSLGLTQTELAKTLNVSQPALSQFELGKRPFPASHLPVLAKALNVPEAILRRLARPSRRGSARRPRLRPAYPIGATMKSISRRGEAGRQLCENVKATLDPESLRMLVEDFPRDTPEELTVALKLASLGAVVRLVSPGQMRCPLLTMHDLDEGVGDHLLQPAIEIETHEMKLLVFGQVPVNVPRVGPIRFDFLIYCKPKGQRGYWIYLEIDGHTVHELKRGQDEKRDISVGIPGLRYENQAVRSPWFIDGLLRSIRELETEAARRRLSRRRRARRIARQRVAQAQQARRRAEGDGEPSPGKAPASTHRPSPVPQ